jgi:hypothetical protein
VFSQEPNMILSDLGSFQVPSRPSDSIWNAGWWIRRYSNVSSNN